ncbi:MAG: helix-turn-helix domain-containing protein [Candidatus Pacebacteria bacterium]|nr:helix-turn-helix domain-containing protein [Candidatus Paceibacterota bacterium]
MNDKFYSLQEVADLLKLNYLTVFRWAKVGKLPAYKFGKQYRIDQITLDEFIAKSKVKIPGKDQS